MFNLYINFRPGPYFIMILDPVAPFSQSMSPWRAMATHFGPKTVIFRPPLNANICYRRPKILILGLCMYCKHRNMYCRYKYMSQRYTLYVSNMYTICTKDPTSILQVYNLYVVHTDFYMSQIHTLSMSETKKSVYYIHRICIYLFDIHRICIIQVCRVWVRSRRGCYPSKDTCSIFYK